MGGMTELELIDPGVWHWRGTDPIRGMAFRLRIAGWRNTGPHMWTAPCGDTLTACHPGFLIHRHAEGVGARIPSKALRPWHGGRHGMPVTTLVDADWREHVALILARDALKVMEDAPARPCTSATAGQMTRLRVRCELAARLYPPADPDAWRDAHGRMLELEKAVRDYTDVECAPSPVFPALSFAGGTLLPIGMFMLGHPGMERTGATLTGMGIGLNLLASLMERHDWFGGASPVFQVWGEPPLL